MNACVLDHPKQSVPASSTSWCDFDPCYADGEVAARNPVDVKFNMVCVSSVFNADEGGGTTVLQRGGEAYERGAAAAAAAVYCVLKS